MPVRFQELLPYPSVATHAGKRYQAFGLKMISTTLAAVEKSQVGRINPTSTWAKQRANNSILILGCTQAIISNGTAKRRQNVMGWMTRIGRGTYPRAARRMRKI